MSRPLFLRSCVLFVIALSASAALRAQDACGGATELIPGATCTLVNADATGATQSLAPVLCNGHTSPQANDLWFTFSAVGTATTIQVDSPGSFDAVVEAFSGDCDALTSIGCADEAYPPNNGTVETLTLPTVPGTVYFVRVYPYWLPAPTEFAFGICALDGLPPPANDLCSAITAQDLAVGASLVFTGDNTDALDSEGLGAPSVWEAFTLADCANVTLDLCGTTPAFANVFDALYRDCSLTAPIPASTMDAQACGDGNATLRYQNLAAGTYYYAVRSDAGSIGAYTLTATAAACSAYCTAEAGTCDEYIARVICNGVDLSTDCTPGGYADHTGETIMLAIGSDEEITVHNGPSFYNDDQVVVWVDWDHDLSFMGANETTVLSSADDGATFTGTIQVPAAAEVGTTRMRIRMLYAGEAYACDSSRFGEVEDYTANVQFGVGIDDRATNEWNVFPNPTNGDFTIAYGAADANVTIDVLDLTGRLVHTARKHVVNGERVAVQLAGRLAEGSYVVRLSSDAGRTEQRIVVR